MTNAEEAAGRESRALRGPEVRRDLYVQVTGRCTAQKVVRAERVTMRRDPHVEVTGSGTAHVRRECGAEGSVRGVY